MECPRAAELLKSKGYKCNSIQAIPEGNSHSCFDVTLADGIPIIVKFEKSEVRLTPDRKRRDYHYNGELSLERQASLCTMFKNTGLPSPEVKGLYEANDERFIILEKLPGQHWSKFLEEKGYSLEKFLQSMEYLGGEIALAQKNKFKSFGDIFGKDDVRPGNITHFAGRLQFITQLKLNRAEQSGSLSEKELNEVREYFDKNISMVAEYLPPEPVLVITDLHGMNFLVDDQGKPSGFFDLEFCQAGVPALEFYHHALHLFNYFNQNSFVKAREMFFKGFFSNGGDYDYDGKTNAGLERILCAGHLLACNTAYYGAGGFRKNWSADFKELLFQTIATGEIPYIAVADIFRAKTRQPNEPSLP